jgi:hypothetical protein
MLYDPDTDSVIKITHNKFKIIILPVVLYVYEKSRFLNLNGEHTLRVISEVLTAMVMKAAVFWFVTPHSLAIIANVSDETAVPILRAEE